MISELYGSKRFLSALQVLFLYPFTPPALHVMTSLYL